ncbi:hypothetical protein MTO96_048020 [Rhipicephalus appendiculatus]
MTCNQIWRHVPRFHPLLLYTSPWREDCPFTLRGSKSSVSLVIMSAANACQKKPTSTRYAAVLFVVAFAASQVWSSALANKHARADKLPAASANASASVTHNRQAGAAAPAVANASNAHLHHANHGAHAHKG